MNGLFGSDASALNTMPDENMRKLQWRRIDPAGVNTLYNIHVGNSLAARCRNHVLNHLFSAELEILNGDGERLVFDPGFSGFLQKKYVAFLKDAYDMYMVYGVVPVVLMQDNKNKHFYPVVPKFGTFILTCAYAIDTERMYFIAFRPLDLKVVIDDDKMDPSVAPMHAAGRMRDNVKVTNIDVAAWREGRPHAVWFDGVSATGGALGVEGTGLYKGDGQWVPDATIRVITGLGSDPGINGELRSPLTSILANIAMTSSLCRYMLQSEYRMVNPAVTMQYHKTENPDTLEQYKKIAQGVYYDESSLFVNADRQAVETSDAQLRAIQAHLHFRALEDMHNMGVQEQEMTRMNSVRVQAGEGTACIPKGLEYVKNDSNVTQAGAKYLGVTQLTDDHIAGCYGIPLALLRNAGALRGNITGQNEIFRQMLLKNARMLGDIATTMFTEIFVRDNGMYCDEVYGRKAAVDDSMFVRYGMDVARKNGMEVIRDEAGELATPPPLMDVMIGDTSKKQTLIPEDSGMTPEDLMWEIDAVIEANKKARALALIERRKKKNAKNKQKGGLAGLAGVTKNVSDKVIAQAGVYVRINVTHMMNDKSIEHLFDIAGIELYEYQNIMRDRNGFSSTQRRKQPSTTEKMVGDLLRDPNSEGPREDSFIPEGVGLHKPGQAKKVVPPGMLLELARNGTVDPKLLKELAQFGGNVEKWRTYKKEQQREAEAKAKQKVAEKRKRTDKKDKKTAKKAKKS